MIWLQSSPEVSGDQQNSSQWTPSPNFFHTHGFAGMLTDSWERLRESAAGVLARLPTPLPGLETPKQVQWQFQLGFRSVPVYERSYLHIGLPIYTMSWRTR